MRLKSVKPNFALFAYCEVLLCEPLPSLDACCHHRDAEREATTQLRVVFCSGSADGTQLEKVFLGVLPAQEERTSLACIREQCALGVFCL